MTDAGEVTVWIERLQRGENGAWQGLLDRVEGELRGMAHAKLARERDRGLLQTTALVNECWLRLAGRTQPSFENRGHFFAAAARAMRCLLIDEARKRGADKRGAGLRTLPFGEEEATLTARNWEQALEEVECVDRALQAFAAEVGHGEHAKLVELHYFAGLSLEEIAALRGASRAQVKRQWDYSRAWLRREISRLR